MRNHLSHHLSVLKKERQIKNMNTVGPLPQNLTSGFEFPMY